MKIKELFVFTKPIKTTVMIVMIHIIGISYPIFIISATVLER